MAGATPWIELELGGPTGYVEGFPSFIANDLYEDFLFEGAIEAVTPVSYTELSLGSATPHTELSTPSTAYVELTL